MLYAIVPVKRLIRAKTRLAPVLSFAQRLALARRFLHRTLVVTEKFPGAATTVVVSADPAVRALARRRNMIALHEPGAGDINRAVEIGCRWARAHGATAALVLPTDLPLLHAGALHRFARRSATPVIRLAGDRHGAGTNALYLQPVRPGFARFGAGSLERHRARALILGTGLEVAHDPCLGFDVDVPADLAALCERAQVEVPLPRSLLSR